MNIKDIPIKDIKISKLNTRKDTSSRNQESDIQGLKDSISENGLLSPITVRKNGSNYDIIAGQRRYQACKELELEEIPCNVLKDISDDNAVKLSLIENVQRNDMKPMDKANAYLALYEKHNDWDIVAKLVGVKPQTIKKYTDMLKLSEKLQSSTTVQDSGVEVLSKLAKTFPDENEQEEVYEEIQEFNQGVGKEILKQCQGDKEKIPDLVDQAKEGAFKSHTCHEGLCFDMTPEIKEKVKVMIKEAKEKLDNE